MHIISLDDRTPFTAISYVWGDQTDTRNISIDDITVAVTLNLYDVLCWYGREDNSELARAPVWADGMCINQADLTEKGHQIHLMSQIYEKATRTICWLGPSTPRLEDYLRWGQCISLSRKDRHLAVIKSASWLRLYVQIYISKSARHRLLLRRLQTSPREHELFSLPYFQRTWTLQESILPGSRALFVLNGIPRKFNPRQFDGPSSFGGLFGNAVRNFLDSKSQTVTDYEVIHEVCSPWFSERSRILKARTVWLSISDGSVGIRNLGDTVKLPLGALLGLTALRDCLEPIDRIFALLGIVKCETDAARVLANRLLTVDYTKRTDMVFLDALHYIYLQESPADMTKALATFDRPRS